MSNFNCPTCGTAILEDSNGYYYTSCEHYPIEDFAKSQVYIPKEFRDVLTNWNYREDK